MQQFAENGIGHTFSPRLETKSWIFSSDPIYLGRLGHFWMKCRFGQWTNRGTQWTPILRPWEPPRTMPCPGSLGGCLRGCQPYSGVSGDASPTVVTQWEIQPNSGDTVGNTAQQWELQPKQWEFRPKPPKQWEFRPKPPKQWVTAGNTAKQWVIAGNTAK